MEHAYAVIVAGVGGYESLIGVEVDKDDGKDESKGSD